jgi:hypothetical protein
MKKPGQIRYDCLTITQGNDENFLEPIDGRRELGKTDLMMQPLLEPITYKNVEAPS